MANLEQPRLFLSLVCLIIFVYVTFLISDFVDLGMYHEIYDRYLTNRWTFTFDDILAIGVAVAILIGIKLLTQRVFKPFIKPLKTIIHRLSD
jgi:hypothetical protein